MIWADKHRDLVSTSGPSVSVAVPSGGGNLLYSLDVFYAMLLHSFE